MKKSKNKIRQYKTLKKVDLFKNFSDVKIFELIKKLKKRLFNNKEVIITEGTVGNELYLLVKGKVKFYKENLFLRQLEQYSYFGEKSLLSSESIRTATVIASDTVKCLILEKEDFISLIDEAMISYLSFKLKLENSTLELKDLTYINFLGKGKFGNVYKIHDTEKNEYALKMTKFVSDDESNHIELNNYIYQEKRILLSIDHPFINKLVKTFKYNDYCIFLQELVEGRSLDSYLSQYKGKRDFYLARFYIATLLIAVDYLNKSNIVHRDIKPSNIIISNNGYLKLIDFGTGKILNNDFTYTVIGTPYYMAPEVFTGKGYNYTCDYWSMGVCMFEIYYGYYPFGNYAYDILDVYRQIKDK